MTSHERRLQKLETVAIGPGLEPVELLFLNHDEPERPERPGVHLVQVRFIEPEREHANR